MAYGARQVPQNIMSVEFKLFDFMTLKQFGISIGILLFCFALFYLLPTPWNIVLPIFIIVIGGVVIFVPFNGEPFQEFLSSYLEAMISSQRRIWHKKGIVVQSAAEKAKFYRFGNDPVPENENTFKFVDQNAVKITPEQTQLDSAEQKFLTNEEAANYKPPQQVGKSLHVGNVQSSSSVSQKAVHNSANMSGFTKQQPQHQVNPQENIIPQSPQQQTVLSNDNVVQQANPSQPQQHEINKSAAVDLDDELTVVKNFIFGSVETFDEKPVRGAAVILRQNGQNIEVMNTTDVGEFKTSYEYKAGQYELYVNVESREFNIVTINHDPIDPVPVTIMPAGSPPAKVDEESQAESFVQDTNNDEIFQGSYDPKMFDLGSDYSAPSSVQQNVQSVQVNNPTPIVSTNQVEPQIQQTPSTTLLNENAFQQADISIPISASQKQSQPNSTYANQASNMFDQFNANKMPSVFDTSNDVAPQNVPPAVPQPIQPQIFEFATLPNAHVPFEENLISVPNTINGVLVDPNGYGIPAAEVVIADLSNNLVTSTKSDQTGKFYSYSPIANGTYNIYLYKDSQNIGAFRVTLNGNVIPAKFINFKY